MNHLNKIINVDDWTAIDEYGIIYPEGAREKILYRSPESHTQSAIKSNHRYLFKESRKSYPWQFWCEIIAYRLGQVMGVEVPPAYVASRTVQETGELTHAALIEWFYGEGHMYYPGGLLISSRIPNFDHKTGRQHNLATIIEAINDNPLFNPRRLIAHIACILAFDTVIGNTDRHQDNWGVIYNVKSYFVDGQILENNTYRFVPIKPSPAFDNGTAMGHEILEENFKKFENPGDPGRRDRYLRNTKYAHHHMKWNLQEQTPINFFDFMVKLTKEYPYTNTPILKSLEFTRDDVEAPLGGLVGLVDSGKFKLTERRLTFTINLIMDRRELLLEALNSQ